jgi:hypothetical protein
VQIPVTYLHRIKLMDMPADSVSPMLGMTIVVQLKQTGEGSRQTLSIPTARHDNRCPAEADGGRIPTARHNNRCPAEADGRRIKADSQHPHCSA